MKAQGDYVTAQVELTVPDVAPTTIVLARQGIVRGVVVDDAGQPVARATLAAPEVGVLADSSRKDGSFELKVAPDATFTLWAEHARHAPSARLSLSLAPGEQRDGIVLQLGALAHVSGAVVDPHGLPVSGRSIRAYHQPAAGAWMPSLPRGEAERARARLAPGVSAGRANPGRACPGPASIHARCASLR